RRCSGLTSAWFLDVATSRDAAMASWALTVSLSSFMARLYVTTLTLASIPQPTNAVTRCSGEKGRDRSSCSRRANFREIQHAAAGQLGDRRRGVADLQAALTTCQLGERRRHAGRCLLAEGVAQPLGERRVADERSRHQGMRERALE